jgi:hypothetical protein
MAKRDGVAAHDKNNGDGLGRGVGGERRQPVVIAFRPAALDNDVAALNVTGLRQALSKRFPTTCQCQRSTTRCGIVAANARPNWKERP